MLPQVELDATSPQTGLRSIGLATEASFVTDLHAKSQGAVNLFPYTPATNSGTVEPILVSLALNSVPADIVGLAVVIPDAQARSASGARALSYHSALLEEPDSVRSASMAFELHLTARHGRGSTFAAE
jgi:hypothetical protein